MTERKAKPRTKITRTVEIPVTVVIDTREIELAPIKSVIETHEVEIPPIEKLTDRKRGGTKKKR
jgi:hypothetical protein